ncbi:MAG: 50S ribosomal protein L11 methyltransferase [Thermoanaerobaculia bacterium]
MSRKPAAVGRSFGSRLSAPGSRPKYSRLVVPRKGSDDSLVGLLSLYGPLGFLEEGRDLVACFRDPSAARAAGQALAGRGVRHRLDTDLPERDPLEAYRAASRPFPVGRRLWVDPGDLSAAQAPAGRIALRLPASLAFGTGEHESTRLALLALDQDPPEGMRVLDAGTGSGVLALAAAALGAESVVAYDTDAQAVVVARENVRRHAFGVRVRLFAGMTEALAARFALVVANLLPDEFFGIRAALLSRVEPRGRFILSGIPSEREAAVVRRLRSPRWRLAGRLAVNGWTCLSLERV